MVRWPPEFPQTLQWNEDPNFPAKGSKETSSEVVKGTPEDN
ncbi:hypothetical protein CCACVL1_28089 [Corchorus capsularis]|uniref:Uncharacterized protein n=1 Tax=Corchorus capsularis TaxID=210143 RepID=A0A1R3G7J9_COCAP|nr:hypothetical protein CCACVL1_28089 [Corchorus capsularis]